MKLDCCRKTLCLDLGKKITGKKGGVVFSFARKVENLRQPECTAPQRTGARAR